MHTARNRVTPIKNRSTSPVRNRVTSMGPNTFLLMVSVMDRGDEKSRNKDELCRVMLRLHTHNKRSGRDKYVYADLPVTTVRCLMRSHDPVLAEVEIRNNGTSLIYEAACFPVGGNPNEWYELDAD